MSLAEVIAIASRHGLKLIAKQRHRLMLFPGMAELLGRWVIPYDLFVQNRPSLSRHSEDVILLFELHVITQIDRGGAEQRLFEIVQRPRAGGMDAAVAHLRADAAAISVPQQSTIVAPGA